MLQSEVHLSGQLCVGRCVKDSKRRAGQRKAKEAKNKPRFLSQEA